MRSTALSILSFALLTSGSLAHPRRKVTAYHDDTDDDQNDPISQTSRVTAFVNTNEGLKIQCWEIGDFLPSDAQPSGGASPPIRGTTLAGNIEVTLFSFAPSVTLFSSDKNEVKESVVDFRSQPNLFTVKDGLILVDVDVNTDIDSTESSQQTFVFADVNGDDWFYFEDTTSPSSRRSSSAAAGSTFSARTVSGSDTAIVDFRYEEPPEHRVLHEGRCNFAGLKPVEGAKGRGDRDGDARAEEVRFREQL